MEIQMWPEDHTKVDRLLLQGKRPEVESRKLWEETRKRECRAVEHRPLRTIRKKAMPAMPFRGDDRAREGNCDRRV